MVPKKIEPNNKPVENNEGGILASLFRQIIGNMGYNSKVNYFVESAVKVKDTNSYNKVKSKSTIVNNIYSTSMTIKVFIDLLKNVFRAKSIKFVVEVEFHNGSKVSGVVNTDFREDKRINKEEGVEDG